MQIGQVKISYQLHIRLHASACITVGRLGRFTFPAGNYIYTGSAKTNIIARVARHLAKTKRNRWHVDYLLTHCCSRVFSVILFSESECAVNRSVRGIVLVPGFGSTDCQNGCGSHLKYMGEDTYESYEYSAAICV